MREEILTESFAERSCLPVLGRLQNEDGGWGFAANRASRVETTAWAILALQEFPLYSAMRGSLDRGLSFIVSAQLEDGGWPAVPGDKKGCWVTSLACLTLLRHKAYAEDLSRGLAWLNDDRPRDSSYLWRIARKLFDRRKTNEQNPSLSGWSWTPRTASWVEPTAYALIVQSICAMEVASPEVIRRKQLGEAMLYDRMCPGGGWNCGNPRVYGVDGQPQVGPTVWALVALRANPRRTENQLSLDWLESSWDRVNSPESQALAIIGLRLYGRRNALYSEKLKSLFEKADLPWSIPALAWAALAMSEFSEWLNTCKGIF